MLLALGCVLATLQTKVTAAPLPPLAWPTPNHALAEGRPQDFFQYVDRTFEGVSSRPWQGGTFGFTRSPVRMGGKVVMTKFHEGIDVKPVVFDARGVPVDPIFAIAEGRVAHVSVVPSHSTYGNYVVIEHRFGDGPFYSLYSHIASASVKPGQQVAAGERIGTMGWTGPGLDQRRAHLHLELCLLVNRSFPRWHQQFASGTNHHGIHNGINLIGFDIAPIYRAQSAGRQIDLAAHLRAHPVAWKARLTAGRNFELPKRYPWLVDGGRIGPGGVEISFTRDGMPVSIRRIAENPERPIISIMRSEGLPPGILTNRRLGGTTAAPTLTPAGERFLRLITGEF